MTPLRVAVDAHNVLDDWRGIARYVRAVLVRLAVRDDVALALLTRRRFFAHRALAERLGTRSFRVAHRVPRRAHVAWHPWNGTFFESGVPSVVTFHDAVPFAFPAGDRRRRRNEQGPWLRSARTARAFIANSQFTAREIERDLGIDPAAVSVTPLAVETETFTPHGARASLRGGKPYVLFVGAAEARKNFATLLAAHERAFSKRNVALVAAGGRIDGAGVTSLGAVEPRELARWYRGALAVAVPSLYEGFGFPLLEAMACGAPAVATRATSLPEVGGDAPLWVDVPEDVEAWSAALRAVAEDAALRERLRGAGITRAAGFSWDVCAEQTLEILRRASLSP